MDVPFSEQNHGQLGSELAGTTHKPAKELFSTSTVWTIELLSAAEFISVAGESLVFLYSAMIANMFISGLTLSFLFSYCPTQMSGGFVVVCLGYFSPDKAHGLFLLHLLSMLLTYFTLSLSSLACYWIVATFSPISARGRLSN